MASLNWCKKQGNGITSTNPSANMSKNYIDMAKNALGTMNRERKFNKIFSVVYEVHITS